MIIYSVKIRDKERITTTLRTLVKYDKGERIQIRLKIYDELKIKFGQLMTSATSQTNLLN